MLFRSQKLFDMTGWTRDELIGKNWFRILRPPEQREEQLARFVNNVKSGTIEPHYEGDLMARDGRRFLIEWNRSVMRNLDGTIVGVAAIGQDITEARKAEQLIREANVTLARSFEQLQASEARLRRIFEMIPDPLATVDARTGVILDVSRSWEEQTGFSRADAIGKTAGEIFRLDEEQIRELSEVATAATDAPFTRRTWPVMRKDGSRRTFAVSTTTLAAGEQRVGIWLSRDITDELRLADELRELSAAREASLRQLRAITDNLPVAITYTGRDRILRFANRTTAAWLARPLEQIVEIGRAHV